MCLELAKLISLLLSILSIYAVFHAAFLAPSYTFDERMLEALKMLGLAACASLLSGLIFRDWARQVGLANVRVRATFPVRMFLWASTAMLVLFAASWYLETYFVSWKPVYAR